ncbi:hypothetical protein PR003_g7646 [Phytophthora rubi]|uniref:Uncharacterized protein n=1 Tax=Phytophthora rubi TaxID=129364 RepID=A0A6A4FTF2_9STRA|nr:hypothetical protein PR001_g7016 [Phytophthora rubi]KAE9040566.1 hypothetical protein PR002_g4898 [Phytophthora rubi]KAE9346011.1 hypothetical protein PR003_g7646 [Phytophthora rubi]
MRCLLCSFGLQGCCQARTESICCNRRVAEAQNNDTWSLKPARQLRAIEFIASCAGCYSGCSGWYDARSLARRMTRIDYVRHRERIRCVS